MSEKVCPFCGQGFMGTTVQGKIWDCLTRYYPKSGTYRRSSECYNAEISHLRARVERSENVIAGLLFVIDWLGDYVDDVAGHDNNVKYLYETKWQKEFLPLKFSKHSGDCTNECHACIRCQMDEYFKKAKAVLEAQDEAPEVQEILEEN